MGGHGETYVRVHPEFRAIFTSNPREYAGIHDTQDALLDRLITIDLDFDDEETEIGIVAARANLDEQTATRLVKLVRAYRDSGHYDQTPTMRAAIMIGKIISAHQIEPSTTNALFNDICLDVLASKKVFANNQQKQIHRHRQMLKQLIETHC